MPAKKTFDQIPIWLDLLQPAAIYTETDQFFYRQHSALTTRLLYILVSSCMIFYHTEKNSA